MTIHMVLLAVPEPKCFYVGHASHGPLLTPICVGKGGWISPCPTFRGICSVIILLSLYHISFVSRVSMLSRLLRNQCAVSLMHHHSVLQDRGG